MKQKKRELNLYSFYDFSGMARHLEEMARQGWQLERIGSQFWHYRRCPPAELHYAVVYFPRTSQFDPEPPQEQRDFWELCKATGWELIANRYQMQIFCNPASDPTPIETDPVVQVENVHDAMKRGTVLPQWLLLGCSVLQIWMKLSNYRLLRDLLTSGSSMMVLLLWVLLGINAVIELISSHRWWKKAAAAAREEGILLSPKSHRQWNLLFLLAAILFSAISVLSIIGFRSHGMIGAVVAGIALLYAAILDLVLFGSRRLMKTLHLSARANLIGNIAITVITAFVLLFGVTRFAVRLTDNPLLWGHRNTEELPSLNGNYTYTVYHDPLPLTVEDLTGESNLADYSCYRDGGGTPLLTKYTFYQEPYPTFPSSDAPELHYSVYKPGPNCLYEPIKKDFFKDRVYTLHGQIDFVIPHGWEAADAVPWGALDAYQHHEEDGRPTGSYLLCYEDRFVEIQFDDWDSSTPTAEQMTLVRNVLGFGSLT